MNQDNLVKILLIYGLNDKGLIPAMGDNILEFPEQLNMKFPKEDCPTEQALKNRQHVSFSDMTYIINI
jgi:hypothetical protein